MQSTNHGLVANAIRVFECCVLTGNVEAEVYEFGTDGLKRCGDGIVASRSQRRRPGGDVIADAVWNSERSEPSDGVWVPVNPTDQPMRGE